MKHLKDKVIVITGASNEVSTGGKLSWRETRALVSKGQSGRLSA